MGEVIPDQVDHANGDKADNRWSNLRPANDTQNRANQGKLRNNTSGYKGVTYYRPNGSWQAQIGFHGKNIYLGRYNCPKVAYRVYERTGRILYGEYFRG